MPDDRAAALAALLTPELASVVRPLPRMHDASKAEKLAFLAELGRRVDARDHLSDDPAWRAIMAWPEPGDTLLTFSRTAPDQSPLRYPVPAGRFDPALDFAASVAVGWLEPKTLSCRFPLRARFLLRHGLLRGPLPLDLGQCPVDGWAEWPRVDGVEALYVTPTWGDPSASMGHVIFRVRHVASGRASGESFAPVFAYSAIDAPSKGVGYLLRGMTGGLTASIRLETFGDVYRRYAIDERRDLEVYDLRLAREDLHDLLAEVWAEHEDQMAVPYAFFSVNCASLAWDLMRAVRPDLPERASLLTHPHEVVGKLLEAGLLAPRGASRRCGAAPSTASARATRWPRSSWTSPASPRCTPRAGARRPRAPRRSRPSLQSSARAHRSRSPRRWPTTSTASSTSSARPSWRPAATTTRPPPAPRSTPRSSCARACRSGPTRSSGRCRRPTSAPRPRASARSRPA
ncbi:MAG: DUF4105 domain-containing protein [Myxococcota bacterium]